MGCLTSMIFDNVMLILSIIAIILAALWNWLHHSPHYWKRHGIPYIKPYLIFGNIFKLILLKKNLCDTLTELYQHPNAKDQAVLGIYVFNRPCLLIRDLKLLKRILLKDFDNFSNRSIKSDFHSDPLGAHNLFVITNPRWKQIRVKLSPLFSSGKMREVYPLILNICVELDKYLCGLTAGAIEKTIIHDVKDITTLFTIDVVARFAYDIEANSFNQPDGAYSSAGKRIFDFTPRRAIEMYSMFFFPQLVRIFGFKFFTTEVTTFLRNLIKREMDERTKSGLKRNDLIALLMELQREAVLEKEKKNCILQGDCLIAQAAIFFSAGFETTGSTIAFGLYELAKAQDLQARLRTEIRDALAANDGELTYEILYEMKFLDYVVHEVLRLYPVMPFLNRECLNECGAGYSLKYFYDFVIPNGMPIFIPVYQLHRDPKYFPEPENFNPNRFSPAEIYNNNMAAYLPFGMGPRNCIGERFAILQTKIGLVYFLRSHYVKTSDRTPKVIKLNPRSLTLQSVDGLHLKIVHDPLI